MYKQIQEDQFTDVLTPVQRTPTQDQLWEQFKSGHFFDVDYSHRSNGQQQVQDNLEVVYDVKGNAQIFEKVISGHPVKMTTRIRTDVDPTEGLLEDIKNPLQPQYIDNEKNKDIRLNVVNDDYATANKNQMWGLDKMLDQIDQQLKMHKARR